MIACYSNAQKDNFKHINFTKADSIAHIYKDKSVNSLPILSLLLTSKLDTDVEKFRAIYSWVSRNIKGDHAAVSKNTRKRKRFKNDSTKLTQWNNSFNKVLFKKLLKDKKTVCTGYAYLIRELCTLANIESKIIDGYGRSAVVNIGKLSIPNHSWNAVKLNNKWYLADATWSTGYTDLSTNTFIFDYNDGYFLTEPQLFIKSHFPLDKKWSLLQKETILTDKFVNAPLIYGATFKHQIVPIYPKEMINNISKNGEIIFQLQAKETIDLNKIEIQIGKSISAIKPSFISRKNQFIFINYKFKIKGFYDVHLRYKNNVIATYTFKVNS
ncbi:transglutaminase domain-containing protein [Polaribacter sp. L3A8]|uniref:transglutaminase domain-containing protein n=1 Tax=Polaribacter sp. L3A8 TaxID=2686361 RepID=UPI00131B4344|nr:transglutaminase domain-containing protein [Polaribacter sp. L3A8]